LILPRNPYLLPLERIRKQWRETIENNIRRLIIDETPANPKYFERMSVLLDELVRERKQGATEYQEYLKKIVGTKQKG
jgi:type I restriction enzyme R subunit